MRSFGLKPVSFAASTAAPPQSGGMMLLKSMLGIDPAEIMAAANSIKKTVEDFDARLARMEAKIDHLYRAFDLQPTGGNPSLAGGNGAAAEDRGTASDPEPREAKRIW